MDIVTQGLLGAVTAQAGAKTEEVRTATLIGFLAGLVADADIFIRSAEDSLLNLEYHRHFSHSLFFVPFGALIAASLLYPFLRTKLHFRRIYIYALLGYCLSGVLDAFTSYGTQLLWPLTDTRFAWSLIAVVDPVFSGALLVGLILVLKKQHQVFAKYALLFAGAYLVLGFIQQQRASDTITDLAQERGHTIERLVVKPTLGNLLLWRTVYQTEQDFVVDAVRVGFGHPRTYIGTSIARFKLKDQQNQFADDSVLASDIRRFARFSDDYLAWHPQVENVLVDVRYANIPNQISPLWGIELNPAQPERHAVYKTFRDVSKENRKRFMQMLVGD